MLPHSTTPDVDAFPRFWSKVQIGTPDECWLWLAPKDKDGYARIRIKSKLIYVHRISYKLLVGPIPDGLTIDHLCRNRACVNPKHLESVTHRTNVLRGFNPTAINARKTHCIHGHEFTPANTYLKGTARYCRACHNLRAVKKRREKNPLGLSMAEINRAKTHCVRGHAFTIANTYWVRRSRQCRKCKALISSKSKTKGS